MTNKEKKYRLMELMFVILVSTIVGMISGGAAIFTMLDIKEINYVDKKDDLEEVGAVYEDILNNYYKDVDKEDLIKGAIDGMMSVLGDPNSSYYDDNEASSFNDRLNGRYLGVGLEILSDGQGNTFVVGIFEDSPASKSNLIKEGDFILEVDGVSVKTKSAEEIASLIKKSAEDKVVITFERDGKQYNETLTAGYITIKSIESKVIEQFNKKIGYIKITIFAANTEDQFSKALQELESKKIDSLIIDVRNNSGGYLTSVTDILEKFLPKNTVLYKTKDSENTLERVDTTDEKRSYNVVVITNEASASASEILAVTLSEKYNAKLVGKKTYGKGTVQQVLNTSTGGFAKITIQEWLTPNGKQIDKVGIIPDYVVELDMATYDRTKLETDSQLQKAIEVIVK
jgi:carboxyl-terminal processing protease